jgi:hypothetical protein
MSITTLRTLFASIPDESVERFFAALRLAGWEGSDEDTARNPVPTS